MIDFQWTISIGQVLGTTAVGGFILSSYYRVTRRYREALDRIVTLEKEVARLQVEIITLMETIKVASPEKAS